MRARGTVREMLGLIEVNIGCDACSVIDIDALGRWHDRRAGSDDSPVHHAAHDESDEAGKDVAEDVRHGGDAMWRLGLAACT